MAQCAASGDALRRTGETRWVIPTGNAPQYSHSIGLEQAHRRKLLGGVFERSHHATIPGVDAVDQAIYEAGLCPREAGPIKDLGSYA
jgi:hypothetical protein